MKCGDTPVQTTGIKTKPMHLRLPLLLGLILFLNACQQAIPASEAYDTIQIARDQWGVPHIFAPTDAEVAYGLAWAQCEDDFVTMQEQMIAGRGRLGEVKGKDGITVDFGVQYMGLSEIADKYAHQLTNPHFNKYLAAFAAGANAYASLHPEELLLPDLFPLKEKDLLIGFLLGNVEISGAGKDLVNILEGRVAEGFGDDLPKGSNAIAISNRKTTDDYTYLAINSHQPLEGWYSWYEAHLVSEEGLNILGGTFPGGSCIFHGVNEHLGWAHTVNHADFSDVYQLVMHPEKEGLYRFDGEWLPLIEKPYWAWMKIIGPLKIPIRQTIYESKYGPTFETEKGFFAWRYLVAQGIGAAEQWFKMNKAKNFEEFQAALTMQEIVSTNIVYADKEDNIYYLSNGKLPIRNPNYDWKGTLPGDTSATLWADAFFPIDSLPQVLNPQSGYVFNTNNTPFSASGLADNPVEDEDNKTMGYQATGVENNRSTRLMELMSQHDSLDYATFKKIKYDTHYPSKLTSPYMGNLELMLQLPADKYPVIKDAIDLLKAWNRDTEVKNTTAALFILSLNALTDQLKEDHRYNNGYVLTEADCVQAITKGRAKLMKDHGTLEVPLGSVQRHIRGEVSLPLGGGPDVLAAMYSTDDKEGRFKGVAGESYILLARFGKDGVQLESVNAYGTCAEIGAPHNTDQMQLFVDQDLKPMTLDKTLVLEQAVRVYSPMKIR